MTSYTSSRFWKSYDRLPNHIKRQARHAYKQFASDPQHPSLQFKRVHKTLPVYSVRITLDYRAVGIRDKDTIVWFWIGPHADYDQVIRSLG